MNLNIGGSKVYYKGDCNVVSKSITGGSEVVKNRDNAISYVRNSGYYPCGFRILLGKIINR